jgi:hypothetical protein
MFIVSFSILDATIYKEANLIIGYSENDDLVSESMTIKNSLGFEYFQRFANSQGDFLTLDIQPRFLYDFDSEELIFQQHNLWADFKLGLGRTLRVGHFQPVFGLENEIDTHSSVLQTNAMMNIGMKHDWGFGYKSFINNLDYNIALQSGLGMGLPEYDKNYLLTSRIRKNIQDELILGLSYLLGNVVISDAMQTIPTPEKVAEMKKYRLGVDLQYEFYPFDLMSDISYGENNSDKVIYAFNKLNFKPFSLIDWEFALQNHFQINDLDNSDKYFTSFGLGITYKISEAVKISLVGQNKMNDVEVLDNQVFLHVNFFE